MSNLRSKTLLLGAAMLAVATCGAGFGTAPNAFAQGVEAPGLAPSQDARVSLQQAIAIATQRVKGRVVRADTVVVDGRQVHEILIIRDDGLVRTIHIDPETGAVL